MRIARLLINDLVGSAEGMRLLKEAGIEYRSIPANGHTMPVLLIDDAEYAGLGQIRLYLSLLKSAQKEAL